MKNEFLKQYAHTWNILENIVKDFDDDAWLSVGEGYMVPARLAFHILCSSKYYMEDPFVITFRSGRTLDGDWIALERDQLPPRSDVLHVLDAFRDETATWLSEMDFDAKNASFPWAGETRAGVVIFLMRHTLYHLGELNALLHESKGGNIADHYVDAFRE